MRPKPKLSPLDKKIKPNPKYQGVEAVVQTGPNIRTELDKLGEIQELYKFRNSEVFRRITVNNLVDLIIEVSKLEYQLKSSRPRAINSVKPEQEDTRRSKTNNRTRQIFELDGTGTKDPNETIDYLLKSQFEVKPIEPSISPAPYGHSARSVTKLTEGIGELDDSSPGLDLKSCFPRERPFLILDVRDQDLYSRAHICTAVSYPSMRLNRAFDYETPDMLRLKNKKNCVIVVYDDDEMIASKCTTTLVQRGYENVFMLSGGLRVAKLKYPESLVTDREIDCIEEGDIMVLEKLKEENVARGSYSRLTGSRMGTGISQRSMAPPTGTRRSVSLDRPGHNLAGGRIPGGFPGGRKPSSRMDPPIRTSTALGGSKNSVFF